MIAPNYSADGAGSDTAAQNTGETNRINVENQHLSAMTSEPSNGGTISKPSVTEPTNTKPTRSISEDRAAADALPTRTENHSPAGMAQQCDAPTIVAERSATLQDASGTAVACAPASVSQMLGALDAINGASGATRTYSGMLNDLDPGKLPSAPIQPEVKIDTSDRKVRVQQKGGRESDLIDSGQSSSHDSGQVKQAIPVGKAENLVGQNSPSQSVVVETTRLNASHNTSEGYIPAKENTASTVPTDGSVSSQSDLTPVVPLGSVQTAHLVQHLSETELRVGIQAGEFGKIDIRTSVSQNQLSAQIYVEHGELGKALAEGMSQLHEQLSTAHHMDAQIELYNTGSSYSNGSDRQQHQSQGTPEQNGPASRDADASAPQVEIVPEAPSAGTTMGLDMHI
jgi:hypothetical protein